MMKNMDKLEEILGFLERDFAKVSRQSDWDNSGRQLFLGDGPVSKIAFALDGTEKVINEAIEQGCELLITHHPIFFAGAKKLDFRDLQGRKVIKAAQAGLNIASYHTNLDITDGGLNDYFLNLLNAENIGTLYNEGREQFFKVVVFVPKENAQEIIEAFDKGGAGKIGNYSKCTFRASGTGTFLPGNETNPYIGEKGKLEEVEEFRIESIVPKSSLNKLVNKIIEAHPYEEVAYDVYPLEMGEDYGVGRIGKLNAETDLNSFMSLIKEKTGIRSLRHNGIDSITFDKFAVCTGSGASLWKKAKRAGVKVLVTGDLKHHDALDAFEEGVCIIDAGHYETENIYMNYLSAMISEKFQVETLFIDQGPSIISWG